MYFIPPVIGFIVKTKPDWGLPLVDRWISHENIWLCRVALLHQLRYKTDTDEQRLFRYCLSRCHEEDFFIRKAIGWALRQYAYTDSKAVKEFVEKNKDKLSMLSVKEAMKHIR